MASTPPPNVLADLTAGEPPKGFFVTVSRDGYPALVYRTTGMIGIALFFTLWLSGWTAACGLFTYQMIFTARRELPACGGIPQKWWCIIA